MRPNAPNSGIRVDRSRIALLALLLAALAPRSASAQEPADIPGVVIDVTTREGIEGVALVIEGTSVSAVTDATGAFILRGLPPGRWVVQARHLAYGLHKHDFVLREDAHDVAFEIRLGQEAIELEPVVVETFTLREQAERARGSSRNVVSRAQIESALLGSRNLGDLIRQVVPGIRMRSANNLAGSDMCLEFRGATDISLVERQACNSPMLLLDGVPVSNPNFAYGTIGLNTIQRIEVLPPGEAGARYGTGSLYGVLIIETRDPRPSANGLGGIPGQPAMMPGRRATFDWSQEPRGHNGIRTAGAAFLGNAVGLGLGLAVGTSCFEVDARDQIVTRCHPAANIGAAAAAFVLPAAMSALGARVGGGTDGSVGRFLPAMIGATMSLLPGYVYSLSTVGRGSDTANAAGVVLLLVGTPLAVTVADKLFRNTR